MSPNEHSTKISTKNRTEKIYNFEEKSNLNPRMTFNSEKGTCIFWLKFFRMTILISWYEWLYISSTRMQVYICLSYVTPLSSVMSTSIPTNNFIDYRPLLCCFIILAISWLSLTVNTFDCVPHGNEIRLHLNIIIRPHMHCSHTKMQIDDLLFDMEHRSPCTMRFMHQVFLVLNL